MTAGGEGCGNPRSSVFLFHFCLALLTQCTVGLLLYDSICQRNLDLMPQRCNEIGLVQTDISPEVDLLSVSPSSLSPQRRLASGSHMRDAVMGQR